MEQQNKSDREYHRFHIDIQPTPDFEKWPSRFNVKVNRKGLATLLVKEIFHYKFNKEVILSRPCMYGVFSGPVGGFSPRPQLCVGCLRCTVEFPNFVQVSHNPERQKLGDRYFNFRAINAISYEADSGQVPVKGAGYRGKFGGPGWDGMWTDMSEIVRPTRDGIHGREVISTQVDIGSRPNFMQFDEKNQPIGKLPKTFSIDIPMVLNSVGNHAPTGFSSISMASAAKKVGSIAILGIESIIRNSLASSHLVPLINHNQIELLKKLTFIPKMILINGWEETTFATVQENYPDCVIGLHSNFPTVEELNSYTNNGLRVFHFLADYHGRDHENNFILDLIRSTHRALVAAGIRQEVTLIGGGGIIAAEHIPKAILCGLDAVSLDTALTAALQGKFVSNTASRENAKFSYPSKLNITWATQRLVNLIGSWHAQLLEIMGAMGMREVRRLRGEMGRAMFKLDLEKEAFADIEGYSND
jgi:hypothetical protein